MLQKIIQLNVFITHIFEFLFFCVLFITDKHEDDEPSINASMSNITPSIFLPAKSVQTCSICNKYLSVGPVTISSGKPVCGRCPPATECPALFYENLAKYMYFPCINISYGCDAMLAWGKVSSHEKKCQFSLVECPALKCDEKIMREEIFNHFSKQHCELVINGNQFSVSMEQDSVNKLLLIGRKTMIVKLHLTFPFCYCNVSLWDKVKVKSLKCDILMEDSTKRYSTNITNIPINRYKEKQHNTTTMTELNLYMMKNMWNVWSADTIILTINIATESSVETMLNRKLLAELECPICTNYMKPPICMCPIGHSFCNFCESNMVECPQCSIEMKGNRNFALEKLTEHISFPCKYEAHGCTVIGTLSDINIHQKACKLGVAQELECWVNYLTPCSWRGSRSDMISHISSRHKIYYMNITKPLIINLKQFSSIIAFTQYNSNIFKILVTYDQKAGLNFSVNFISEREKQSYRYFLNFIDRNRTHRFLSLNRICTISVPKNDILDNSVFIKKTMFKPFVKKDKLEVKINIVEI